MDSVNNWKIILLQWIKECGFLENSFYSIEQTEIETFFLKFCEQLKSNVGKKEDLSSFLKEHYPRFEPHFDDENAISYNDYIYVYSLLLHFCCVKCPDEFFQMNCQQLKPAAQENIATFFKELVVASALTKEALRHAIASTSPFKSTRIYADSPIKTPRKTGISPPTPRSCKLQEKSKELISLKAQLENEAYEKGMLELEVKQNQEKIFKLSQELKRTNQALLHLKNDIQVKNTDNCDSEVRHSEDEQNNRRLSKQISQKETEIAKQREDIETLTEEKYILNEKLKHAEQQIKILQQKIEEFALKVDELSSELEQKDYTIQYLLETKGELENFIAETRSSSVSSRPDLNTSVECLDLSRTTNSSGSVNSPENLGCSVVDIQLREKENENAQLREEIYIIRMDNAKLSKQMTDLTVRCSKCFNICNENLLIDHESSGPLENFIVFSNYIESFVHKYEENCIAMSELRENAKALDEQNQWLNSRVAEGQTEIAAVRNELSNLQVSNKMLELTRIELEKVVDDWKNKLEISLNEQHGIGEKLKSLQSEFETLKVLKSDTDRDFQQTIKELKSSVELSNDQSTQLKIDYENKLQTQATQNHKEMSDLQESNKTLEATKIDLEKAVDEWKNKLEISLNEQHGMAEKLKSLQSELETLKALKSDTDRDFQQTIKELKSSVELSNDQSTQLKIDYENKLQTQATQNHKEMSDLQESNKTLEATKIDLEKAVDEWKNKLEISLNEQHGMAEKLKNLQSELETLKALKSDTVRDFQQTIKELKSSVELSNDQSTQLKIDYENKLQTQATQNHKEMSDLQESNKTLEATKIDLEKAVDEWKNKLEISLNEQHGMAEKLKSLQSELETLKALKSDIDRDFKRTIEEMKSSLEISQDRFTQVKIDYEHRLQTEAAQNNTLFAQIKQLNCDGKIEKTQFEAEMSLLRDQLKESSKQLLENKSIIQELEIGKLHQTEWINDLNSQLLNVQKQLEIVQAEYVQINNVTAEREREIFSLATELEQTKLNLDSVANENHKLVQELREREKDLQRLTEDSRQHSLMVSKVQAEKETLISSMQQRIDALRLALDQCSHSFKEQEERLDLTNEKLNSRQTELEKVSSNYMDLEKLLSERAQHFATAVDGLAAELQILADHMNTGKEPSLLSVAQESTDVMDNLKRDLNQLIQTWHKLGLENARLSDTVSKLTQQKIEAKRQISELREQKGESQCERNKLTKEVKRLTDDISNLDNVCDHLNEQNLRLQTNLSELKQVNEDLAQENSLLKQNISDLKSEHEKNLFLAEQLRNAETALRAHVTDMQSSAKRLELKIEAAQSLLAVKTQDAETLLKDRDQAQCTIDLMNTQISKLETKLLALDGETKEKYEAAYKIVQEKCEDKCRKLEESLQAQIDAKQKTLDELNDTVDKLTQQNVLWDNKCHLLTAQLEQSKSDLLLTKTELFRLQCEETKLLAEIQLMRETSTSSEAQAEKYNKEIVEQKENVSRLIGEVASIRREKDALEEEKTRLQKKLAETVDKHSSSNASCKSILEKLQSAEKDILAKQTLLKSEQIRCQDLDNQLKKLQMECTKLRESDENKNNRLEKQALKLGDTMATNIKLKKEAELALEALKSSNETTQRENARLNSSCNTLKDKLAKCEKTNEQLASKLQTLTKAHELLAADKENLEASENELKSAKAALDKSKSNLEEKVRKLAKSLSDSNVAVSRLEQDKVRLSLEVGALNNQLQEAKSVFNMKLKENEDITTNAIETKNAYQQLKDLNEKFETDANGLREENSQLNDQLSKLSLRLQIAQDECDSTKTELAASQAEIVIKKNKLDATEREHLATLQRLNEVEKLADERTEYVEKIKQLETKLAETTLELTEKLKQEQLINAKLNNDINIFQSKLLKSRAICEENELKWVEEKEQMLNEMKASDDRIKETRLELEGKLEKMKNKMKTLYNDEITKIKSKHERELAALKSDCESLKAQNAKYEEHTKKLSSQIFKLNENILEHQKQNTFLKTKLKDLESKPHQFNRIASSHVPQSSAHHALSSNLHMEDEEGEIFNNTYLADLKSGRVSDLFSREICPQELKYRNSLVPPHLKSTYLAQFDHQLGEDEIREIPSLDDSSSTLLNTGQRKKVSGATSYKRPGPPTPSKNAGRLSFGGIGELNREILKESLDTGNYTLSSKTPAKFKLFSSKLKDENTPPINKRRLSNLFKKK